jgi:hypothetical protein
MATALKTLISAAFATVPGSGTHKMPITTAAPTNHRLNMIAPLIEIPMSSGPVFFWNRVHARYARNYAQANDLETEGKDGD